MKEYEGVWRIRTRCHRRWMDCAKARKKRRGLLCPNIISPEIKIYMI